MVEPAYIAEVLGVADHPVAQATFRGRAEIAARLIPALEGRDWLLGDRFSAADILLCSTYLYFPDATPDHPDVRAWVARCAARPSYQRALADD